MQRRFKAVSLVALAALSLFLVGCGKYNELVARKAFKEGTAFYMQQDYKRAAERYQQTIDNDPNYTVAYFYLANSYDNLYKPSRKGEAANDAFLTKAVQNYKLAVEREQNLEQRKLALRFLFAAYGPDKLADPEQQVPIIQKMVELDPGDPANYFGLGKVYEDAGRYDEAEQQYLKAREMRPKDPAVYQQLAGYYNRQGEFDKTIEAYQQWADIDAKNPEVYYTLGAFLWEKVYRDTRLKENEKRAYIAKGLENVDRALQIKPDYIEALNRKGLLIREQARLEKDRTKYDTLMRQAEELNNKATELRKKKAAGLVK